MRGSRISLGEPCSSREPMYLSEREPKMKSDKENVNSGVERKEARERWTQKTGRCPRCKPHRGENYERTPRRNWKFRSRKTKQHE